MAFNFQAAIEAASQVAKNQENQENKNYTYPLVYPQAGSTIIVRPLFNPASGQILRLVNRHEKIACYRTYGQECPICKVQQQVKDLTGQDPFGRSKSSRSRGICFAQFISSTVPIEKGQQKGILQPGEIILFMFPWSVYTQINMIIQAAAQTPTGMDQAFSHADTGLYLQINVNNDFKYTTTNVPYMTFPSGKSDDDFIKMLEGMESLTEQVLPSTITEDVSKQVNEYTDAIYRQYVAPRTAQAPMTTSPAQPMNYGVTTATQPINYGAAVSTTPPQNFQSQAANIPSVPNVQSSPNISLPCFGKHQKDNPQCICCPDEVVCIEQSDENLPFN